jgi:hypothetical protein
MHLTIAYSSAFNELSVKYNPLPNMLPPTVPALAKSKSVSVMLLTPVWDN